jgi:hypothetical protein
MEPFSRLPPLKRHHRPMVALLLGFLFGGVGLGIYFRSWPDFLIGLGLGFVVALITLALGIEPLIASAAVGASVAVYGRLRAIESNERLGPGAGGPAAD